MIIIGIWKYAGDTLKASCAKCPFLIVQQSIDSIHVISTSQNIV